jgi:hypothetical protein
LQSLQNRRIISAVKGERGTLYSVNIDWCPETENEADIATGDNIVRFPVSGRIVRVAKSAPECGNICHSSIGDEQEEDVKVYNRESENSNERDYHVDFEKVWHEAVQSLECPTAIDFKWTKKIAGMVARGLTGWPQGHDRLQAFIVWVVSNWNLTLTNQMSWMDRVTKPDKPDPEFFARHIRHFAAAWFSLETTRWIETLPETERAIETKMRQGMSREGATLEVAKEQFLVANRNERARCIRRAEETYQLAKLDADMAQRHPLSQE